AESQIRRQYHDRCCDPQHDQRTADWRSIDRVERRTNRRSGFSQRNGSEQDRGCSAIHVGNQRRLNMGATKTKVMGAFVLGGVLLFAVGLFLIGDRRMLFSGSGNYYTEYSGISGLEVGDK